MQLTISTCALVALCLSSVSGNAITVRRTKFHHDFDYCGEIINPFTGTSQCVCINQLNEALVHTRFEGLEPLFDKYVREGPTCTPSASTTAEASPTSSADFEDTTDSSTSSIAPLATEMPTDEEAGDEEFPSPTSDPDFGDTIDSSTSSFASLATETATDDGVEVEDQEFGLESLNSTPPETSDSPQSGDEKNDDGDEYVGLDFSLGALGSH